MEITGKKEAERLVNGFFSTLEEVLVKGEELSILGFGKLLNQQELVEIHKQESKCKYLKRK